MKYFALERRSDHRLGVKKAKFGPRRHPKSVPKNVLSSKISCRKTSDQMFSDQMTPYRPIYQSNEQGVLVSVPLVTRDTKVFLRNKLQKSLFSVTFLQIAHINFERLFLWSFCKSNQITLYRLRLYPEVDPTNAEYEKDNHTKNIE